METLLSEKSDTLFVNCHLATMTGNALSIVKNAALSVTGKKISWVGKKKDLPDNYTFRCRKVIDCNNGWILPGFVDCHTHLVWGGSRSDEFEMRLGGATYEEISKKGGGIFSTVNSTRNASKENLFFQASKRVDALLKKGCTTLEIKSGYGLNLETELKMLDVIQQLNKTFPLHIDATFLGAHALPPEFANNADGYIDFVIQTLLPEVKKQGTATAVDAFCEHIAFSPAQKRKFSIKQTVAITVALYSFSLKDDMPKIRKKKDVPVKTVQLMKVSMPVTGFSLRAQLIIQVVAVYIALYHYHVNRIQSGKIAEIRRPINIPDHKVGIFACLKTSF